MRATARFSEAVEGRATDHHAVAAFAYRLGQRDQIVLLGAARPGPGMPHQLPTAWGGNAARVADAKVPGVRLARRGQGADNSR
jgi:hypothetical protein